jgi:hypothetical protein
MFNPLDIASAVEKAVVDLIKIHQVDRWCRLVFTMLFSGTVSFLTVCGAALSGHRPVLEAVGAGMCSAAVMMTVLFRRSDLTKGMMVALPTAEAEAEIKANTQVITKS